MASDQSSTSQNAYLKIIVGENIGVQNGYKKGGVSHNCLIVSKSFDKDCST